MNGNEVKILKVKNGVIEVPVTRAFISDLKRFNKFFQKEARICIARSKINRGAAVDCTAEAKQIMNKFDRLFGNNACHKVFGEGVVSFDAFLEFFEKLEELIYQWCDNS